MLWVIIYGLIGGILCYIFGQTAATLFDYNEFSTEEVKKIKTIFIIMSLCWPITFVIMAIKGINE